MYAIGTDISTNNLFSLISHSWSTKFTAEFGESKYIVRKGTLYRKLVPFFLKLKRRNVGII
jgi:hypothetical protein